MKQLTAALFCCLLLCTSCEKWLMPKPLASTPTATFEYLWQQVDQQYALFDVKGIDWDSVYRHYDPLITDNLTNDSLFTLLGQMLDCLNDGHVNLISPHDVSSSEELFLKRYEGYNLHLPTIELHYLTPQHHTDGGFQYNAIANGSVIYVRYGSFSSSGATSRLQTIVNRYPDAQGLILDMRQNGGGSINNIWNILRLFPSHNQLLYTTQIKNGSRHSDFSAPTAVTAPPSVATPYSKPTVVLIDRGSYSATSFFALCCKQYSNITLVGDTTGGGLGLPTGGGLPNGWFYRLSITRTLDPHGVNYENGVPPDVTALLSPSAVAQGKDNVIETAVSLIHTAAQ